MISKRLYKTDSYLQSNTAKIVKTYDVDGFDSIVCDASVFFPTGGGQPGDIGTVSFGDVIYNVTDCIDNGLDSDVVHVTDAPFGTFNVSDEIELTINWDHRFSNMQRHCGEHMLSGTMHTLFGGVNKGFHMGENYIAIDIDLGGRMLDESEIDLAEKTVNDAIWANLPVTIEYFKDYESSLVRPVRKQVPHDGEVSVVTVGDIEEPYDCIACCGTHPSSTGEIGLLAIYKHEVNKGMDRIFFDCGMKAREYLSMNYSLLTEIANRNSCSPSDLLSKMDLEAKANQETKVQMAKMSSYIRNAEKEKILTMFKDESLCYDCNIIPVSDLLKLGFAVINELENKLLLLVHSEEKTILLFSSGDIKCGALVKEKVSVYNGNGGGRDDNARAVFTSERDMREFARDICK